MYRRKILIHGCVWGTVDQIQNLYEVSFYATCGEVLPLLYRPAAEVCDSGENSQSKKVSVNEKL